MITNAVITIYNRKRRGRESVLLPTVIRDASWFYGRASARRASERGMFMDQEDSYKVRIPYDADTSGKTYINPGGYTGLTEAEAAGYWTIQIDDIVLKGEFSQAVTDERELRELTGDLFVVNSFADNTIRGSDAVKHWRIGGL